MIEGELILAQWMKEHPELTHFGLDVAGLIPGIGEYFDVLNTGLYISEGDYLDAGLTGAAALPVVGWLPAGVKMAKRLPKLGKGGAKCNSFVPETRVLMADGTTKRIDQVRVGDTVIATDPTTGSTSSERVVSVIVGEGQKTLVDIKLTEKRPLSLPVTTTLTATDEHPFYVSSQNRWVDAHQLRPGDLLNPIYGNPRPRVAAIAQHTAPARVYNLTVDDQHTYYVLAGETPVLVHNAGGSYTPPPSDKNLPGFPDAKYVGKGSPKSGGGHRPRWSMPDGRILEWDATHGTIEMWSNGKKNAKHMGEFDANSGEQLPGNKGKPVPGRKLGGC